MIFCSLLVNISWKGLKKRDSFLIYAAEILFLIWSLWQYRSGSQGANGAFHFRWQARTRHEPNSNLVCYRFLALDFRLHKPRIWRYVLAVSGDRFRFKIRRQCDTKSCSTQHFDCICICTFHTRLQFCFAFLHLSASTPRISACALLRGFSVFAVSGDFLSSHLAHTPLFGGLSR